MNKKTNCQQQHDCCILVDDLKGDSKICVVMQLMTFTLEIFLSPCKSVIRITHLQKDLNLQLKQPLFHHISI